MAKRRPFPRSYRPQKMSDDIKRKFELLIGDNKTLPHIDKKYQKLSTNRIYENEDSLKL